MKGIIIPVFAVLSLFLGGIFAVFHAVNSSIEDSRYRNHIYKKSEFVRITLDGRVGIITDIDPYNPRYRVRVVSIQIRTGTHILAQDSPVDFSPYSLVWFNEFELEPVGVKK